MGLLRDAPKSIDIPVDEMAKFFSIEEVEQYIKVSDAYEDYLKKSWKHTYSGDELKRLVDNAPTLMTELNKLSALIK